MIRRNMEKELITEDELMSQLRLHGVEDVSDVKSGSIEGDGGISVIRKGADGQRKPSRRPV